MSSTFQLSRSISKLASDVFGIFPGHESITDLGEQCESKKVLSSDVPIYLISSSMKTAKQREFHVVAVGVVITDWLPWNAGSHALMTTVTSIIPVPLERRFVLLFGIVTTNELREYLVHGTLHVWVAEYVYMCALVCECVMCLGV